MKANAFVCYMRTSSGVEQKGIAKAIGKSEKTVSSYEKGTVMPGFERVRKIADACSFAIYCEDKDSKEIFILEE